MFEYLVDFGGLAEASVGITKLLVNIPAEVHTATAIYVVVLVFLVFSGNVYC
ncbi:hypothetical protein [Arcanobacterium hippocoleae]|uniref:Uncharacterized membrane protein YtjA (UPF0391 family) n=1 Tax=Arcanobacterium hippocoleae TaxID=149017 RepID=A0ABU1T1V4_9ACTO|nr:hypothetical protein [Arcanobacterium hippocoleae]MDR6939313.1 uncharacterized membrane protein YtjA (UPF0391 family) [Arcanobacterium hippocoleae]